MCEQYIVKKEIIISKNKIFNKYSKLDIFFKNCIEVLYGDDNKRIEKGTYNASEIVTELLNNRNEKGSGSFKFLDSLLKDKTGVYIFLDNKTPVYIGVGGTKKGNDLKIRVKNECKIYGETKEESGTLSKNIKDIETELGNGNEVDSFDKIREKIKSYQIITISVGEMLKPNGKRNIVNIHKAEALEKILIALFHPKYNK